MKVFIPYGNMMNQDITPTWPTKEAADEFYHADQPGLLIVEAPDYVYPNWGYDPDADGDERFVRPTPPEGYIYNGETGRFEPEDGIWPEPETPKFSAEEKEDFVEGLMEGLGYAGGADSFVEEMMEGMYERS